MNSLPLDSKGRLVTNAATKRRTKRTHVLPPLLDDAKPLSERLALMGEYYLKERDRLLGIIRDPQERDRIRTRYDAFRYTLYEAISQKDTP